MGFDDLLDELYENTVNGSKIARVEVLEKNGAWHWEIIDEKGNKYMSCNGYKAEDDALKELMNTFDKKE